MLSQLLIDRSNILQEAAYICRKYGKDAHIVAREVLKWHKEHPLIGDDARMPPFLRSNFDYGSGEGLQARLDAYNKKTNKKLKKRIYEAYAADQFIPGYCGKKRYRDYWKKAGKTSAVRDFLKYISQVQC